MPSATGFTVPSGWRGGSRVIGCNPFSGHLLVFCNRRSDRVKILYWDRDGWAIWYKRLEAGTFQFPFGATGRKEVAAWELAVLLEGIDLSQSRRRKRYSLPPAMENEETCHLKDKVAAL
jgi:transposase